MDVWIFVPPLFLSLLLGAHSCYRYWKRPLKKKLEKQILRKAKHLRKMSEEIEAKERKLAIAKRALAQLIHRYRRE